MLKLMFDKQKEFQTKLGNIKKIKECDSWKQEFVNQMILACHEEIVEIMRESAYKNPDFVEFGWKKTQIWNEQKFKEEIIDLWHFVMNLCIAVHLEPEEFFKIYCDKNKINFNRQNEGY